jgi:phosphoribosylaminoimidazole-succinocarboxamide synthase
LTLDAGTHIGSGKVRELYALDDDLLLLTTSDRISTFDVVLPTEIPDKGRVLTGLSAYWFAQTGDVVPNHLRELRPDGRTMECTRLEMVPLECVVRGYLAGSGWKDYVSTGAICGHTLVQGLQESEQLPAPLFTPATKAQTGHDENITRDEASTLIGEELYDRIERLSLDLYTFASSEARRRGIILADTKLEFGFDRDGQLTLADEAFTPDSSRFWDVAAYTPGQTQPSFDKQYVRDYCETLDWNKDYPGPALPPEVVDGTRKRYIDAFELLTGIAFDRYLADPSVVLG